MIATLDVDARIYFESGKRVTLGAKACGVLSFLGQIYPYSASVDQIIDAVWDAYPPASRVNCVANRVSDVRVAFAEQGLFNPIIARRRIGYHLSRPVKFLRPHLAIPPDYAALAVKLLQTHPDRLQAGRVLSAIGLAA